MDVKFKSNSSIVIKGMEKLKNTSIKTQSLMLEIAEDMKSKVAAIAISDTAKGISYAANPLTASLAPPEFMSAAKNAAIAAAFGVAASLVSPDSETSEKEEKRSTIYDEGIEDRIETSRNESEGSVIIDVSDSEISKFWIKQIEKELNDGYNVTLIGKKKR